VKGRGVLGWVVLLLVVVFVAMVVASPAPRSNRPLDPAATGPLGARATVVLLEELGADVTVTARAPDGSAAGADTALLLDDRLTDTEREALRAWVRGGGVLVVADPLSPLAQAGDPAPCPDRLVDGAVTLSLGPGSAAEVSRRPGCFEGFVAASSLGEGDIVTIAAAEVFSNELLGNADNAVLAAGLLAPTGGERVAFMHGRAGSGDQGLFDLLGPRTAQALVQVGIAMVVYVLWRGRRLGRPVPEPRPVEVAGSELVAAVGRMLGSRKRPGEAAATVRADLRRDLERRLGLSPSTPIEHLAAAVAQRTGLEPGRITLALAVRPVATDDDLRLVLTELDLIRDAALQPTNIRPTTGVPS